MPSRASFFSPAIYRKSLTRFFPLWLAYLGTWLVLLPLSLLSNRGNAYFEEPDLMRYVLDFASTGGALICAAYAIFVAMALYGWYFRTASVSALAALPVRREAWFGTNLSVALTVSLIPHLIVALCIWAAAAVMGLPGLSAAAQWFAITSLLFLFFYALAVFCAAVVGQILALPVLFFLLNFTAVVVNYVVILILSTFVYGMGSGGPATLSFLSPVFYLLTHSACSSVRSGDALYVREVSFAHWPYLLGLTAAALVLLVLAFLLLRARRMEAAGDVIAIRPLQPVFKYVFAAGCALVLGSLIAFIISSGAEKPTLAVMVLSLLAGGFIGYFTAEILLKKTFRVFGRAWIGFGVFAACLLLAVCLMEFDLTGFERRVPAADDVETLSLAVQGDALTLDDPAQIAEFTALHQAIVAEKPLQESLARSRRTGGVDYVWLRLTYQLRNGGVLERRYLVYCDEALWNDPNSLPRRLTALINRTDLLLKYATPDFSIDSPEQIVSAVLNSEAAQSAMTENDDPALRPSERLTREEAYELYTRCILPDLREGKLTRRRLYWFDGNPENEYACVVDFTFIPFVPQARPENDPQSMKTVYYTYRPTAGSRTAQFLLDRGDLLLTQAELSALLEQEGT